VKLREEQVRMNEASMQLLECIGLDEINETHAIKVEKRRHWRAGKTMTLCLTFETTKAVLSNSIEAKGTSEYEFIQ